MAVRDNLRLVSYATVVVVATLLFGLNYYVRTDMRFEVEARELETVRRFAIGLANQVEQDLQRVEDTNSDIAEKIAKRDLSDREYHLIMRQAVESNSIVRSMGATNERGIFILSGRTFPSPPTDGSQREYFLHHKNGGDGWYLSEATRNAIDGKWQLSLSVPLPKAADGGFQGIVSAVVDPKSLISRLAYAQTGEDIITLTSATRQIAARLPWQEDLIGRRVEGAKIFDDLAASGRDTVAGVYVNQLTGLRSMASLHRLYRDRIDLFYARPYDQVMAYWFLFETVVAVGSAGMLLLLMAVIGGGWLRLRRERAFSTRLERLNRRLADESLKANRAAQAKSAFLANMSHEIRTPMNAIIGLAQVLQRTRLEADQKDYLDKMLLSGRSLLAIIDDILDFSKAEAGKIELSQGAFDLGRVMSAIGTIMGVNAQNPAVELLLDVDPDVPRHIQGDAGRLEQVLINLTGNAVKFTERGFVKLRVACEERQGDRAILYFTITDSGIGIAPERLQRLFTPFEQADNSNTRRYGGTGLGLAISKSLVDLMGGEIGADSIPGSGSVFWVRLPVTILPDPVREVRNLTGLRVLVVDDSDIARSVLARMVETLGWVARTADSAGTALEVLSSGEKFDVVLMDWQMPGMDGVSATREVRRGRAGGGEEQPLIIMVTARMREEVEKLAGDRLFDAILTKPLSASQLYDAIASSFGPKEEKPVAARSQRLEGLRCLIVEDNRINQLVARRAVELEGASVELAGDGQMAVALLAARPKDFDVVLMDVQMPVMDGLEAARYIRETLALEQLPIIALTAGALSEERERCLAAGMNGFVAKPFNVDALVTQLTDYIPLPSAQESTPPSRAQAPASDASEAAADDAGPLLDTDGLLEKLGGDRVLVVSLYRQMLEQVAGFMEKLEACRMAQDTRGAASLTHMLKGMAGNLGAMRLYRLAAELEAQLRQPVPVQPSHEKMQSLGMVLQSTRDLVRGYVDGGAQVSGDFLNNEKLSRMDIDKLRALLRRNSLDAGDLYELLRGRIQVLMPPPVVSALAAAMDRLDYATAASLLDGIVMDE